MLKLDLNVGQSIQIGDNVTLTLEKKTGQVARLSFNADRSVPIRRVSSDTGAAKVRAYGITGDVK